MPVDPVAAHKTVESLLTGSAPIVSQNCKPEMLRLVPPLHNCEDEVSQESLLVVKINCLYCRVNQSVILNVSKRNPTSKEENMLGN